jgi:hypothetical protein
VGELREAQNGKDARGNAAIEPDGTRWKAPTNVYIFRHVNHQAMFIVTSAGVIATDPIAYGRPTGGQTYVEEIKKITDQPIKVSDL